MTQLAGIHALPFQGAFDVVAIASSAGGLNALGQILAVLPADFGAAVVIVQHLHPRYPSLLDTILARQTALKIKQAAPGDCLAPGKAFIAPPDHHLLVNGDGSLSLTQTELVHFVRPSADLLFESVAASFRTRAIAVVLTGAGIDGEMGVRAIKKMGGLVIAQSAESSEFNGMPNAAIATGSVDLILPLHQIAPELIRLVAGTPVQRA